MPGVWAKPPAWEGTLTSLRPDPLSCLEALPRHGTNKPTSIQWRRCQRDRWLTRSHRLPWREGGQAASGLSTSPQWGVVDEHHLRVAVEPSVPGLVTRHTILSLRPIYPPTPALSLLPSPILHCPSSSMGSAGAGLPLPPLRGNHSPARRCLPCLSWPATHTGAQDLAASLSTPSGAVSKGQLCWKLPMS